MISIPQQFRGFSRNARLLLVTVVCAGMSMALNTLFLNFYLQRLGLSQQLIGVVNALPAVVLVVVGFPVGRLVDRYGPRWGLLIGAGVAVVGSAGIAASGTASAILIFSALLGVGSAFGFISVAPFQMASSTERDRVALFSAQAALMTGTSFVGNLLGGRLPGLMGAWLGTAPDALEPLRATMLATLAQPLLAAKYGKVQSVLLVQIASIPFLLILGFAPFFWLVAVSFVVRNALMNMGNPVYQAFAQEQIPPGEQATYSSLASIAWSLGWASGSTFSGWWRGLVGFQSGFDTAFALMTVLYVTAIGLTYAFFVRGRALHLTQVQEAGK